MLYLIFTEANKDCKDMYDIIISRKEETIKAVYKRNGDEFWLGMCKHFWAAGQNYKGIIGDNLKYYKKIIVTNNYLWKLKLKDTQLCTFCKVKIETNEHFKECSNVTEMECAAVFIKV